MLTSTLFIQHFLNTVDRLSDRAGLSVPPVFQVATLRQLPLGTLGRSLVAFLDQEHFNPLTTGPRRKQLHDAVHVLTGYTTDPIGEAEVQAFLLGAKFHPIQVVLGLGLLGIARRSPKAENIGAIALAQRLQAAYSRGQSSCFDVDTWQPEQQWHLPLETVRREFQL